jgi:hypothetical protein
MWDSLHDTGTTVPDADALTNLLRQSDWYIAWAICINASRLQSALRSRGRRLRGILLQRHLLADQLALAPSVVELRTDDGRRSIMQGEDAGLGNQRPVMYEHLGNQDPYALPPGQASLGYGQPSIGYHSPASPADTDYSQSSPQGKGHDGGQRN